MQTTKKDMKATSAEIEENRAALSSFLAGMRVQVKISQYLESRSSTSLKLTFNPVNAYLVVWMDILKRDTKQTNFNKECCCRPQKL